MNLKAKFYRDSSRVEPVNEYINGLPVDHQVAIDDKIDMLNKLDDEHPHLAFPHSSQVEGSLRELRCQYGPNRYRIFYQRSDEFLMLLHIIRKSSEKLPKTDLDLAKARFADFKERMNAVPKKPPSPTGRKAPPRPRAKAKKS